ncbi:thioesterase family protein [Cognatishimia sp. MH4019]|uniref:acyl-CoA thioesterase n=1 Tax=Cognatishimia sp. MH4019 TaxID=2854030 RepID=UPI001CD342CC|nr:thioesterase family protein [Cognatishimia sp. MH4019]
MSFTLPIKIVFQHCDPAGIVFYPRYFEMINLTVEEWFAQRLGLSFAEMHGARRGVPTATIEADFPAPSRLGDLLEAELTVTKLGRTSVGLQITAKAGDEVRMQVRSVLVYVDLDTGRPIPWPEDVRARMAGDQV